jgi:hypothetical protein
MSLADDLVFIIVLIFVIIAAIRLLSVYYK